MATVILATVHLAQAQPAKVPRIGFLRFTAPSTPRLEAFKQGLRERGYIEGQNIVIEYRYAEGRNDRLPNLAAELVHLRVHVIVAVGPEAVQAAKKATGTIPIVMVASGDPVGTGLIASLARPGGNVTGLTNSSPEMTGKELELLKEAVPRVSRVAVLWNPATHGPNLKELETAASSLRVDLQPIEFRGPEDFESAFQAVTKGRADALNWLQFSMGPSQWKRIVEFATKSRLPTIGNREQVEAGVLMSYGVYLPDLYQRAAIYVDKILKGAKPADLPVEQPMKFELVINLKTAKQIGLTIPPEVLMRADKVIK